MLNCKVGHFWRYGYHYQGALTPKLDIYAGMGLRMFTVSDIFADSRVGHFCRYGYEGEFTVQVRHFCRFGNLGVLTVESYISAGMGTRV